MDTSLRVGPLLVAALLSLAPVSCGDGAATDATPGALAKPLAINHGVWREIPEAPIGVRPYAVSGWSGSEAIFWAGSNLMRDFANTRGAAYDPATDSWRELAVPGWGHPGLTGAVFAGGLYVAAKGGASRIDLSDGSDTDLPQVPGFIPATMVATEGAVWAVGPASYAAEGNVGVGIARYAPEQDAWIPGPEFDGAPELGRLFQDELFVEQPVLSTGAEIVVWSANGHGLSFDPTAEAWRLLPALVPPQGALRDSAAAVAGSYLVALAAVDHAGTTGYAMASWDGAAWTWQSTDVQFTDFTTVSIAGAPDWVVAFGPDHPPTTIHVPTGDAKRHDDAPIGGVQAPNVVWTGDELVVWGGAPTRSAGNSLPPGGALWSPPGS